MADRNRRKSSILKLPKSNARAPLQDVNTLDVKASQDEDFTSHTALARRRVSFAGKNFVKEFCSEADIASVYHAPEYEELLASAESSGLVTSDSSSNTHSSTTIGENNSTFGSRTQNSASKGDNIQDGYDPCDEIMQMFKGSKSTHTEPLKPTGKLRLSFGDICIPNFEDENDLPMAPAGNCQTSTSHSGKDAKENFLITQVTNTASSSVVKSQVKNSQVSFQHGNAVGQEHKSNTKVTKTEVPSVIVCAEARQSAQAKRFIFQDIKTLPSTQSSSPSLVESLGENVSFEDEVFESPKSCLPQGGNKMVFSDESCSAKDSVNAAHSVAKVSQISIDLFSNERANCDLADTTQCMNESMDFTKAVPGIIHLGCLENPVADSMHETMALETSMEFTKCLPSNIQEGFATSKSIETPDDKNGVANHTLAMSTSMEFTRPVPSKIEVGFGGIENVQSNQENCVVNRTVAMSTSMEFTRPVPSKIEVGFGGIEKGQSNQENCVSNRTVAMSTSMEFTRPIPSNIEVGFGGIENGQSNQENCVANRTVAMSTSMEFTRPVPSKIEVGFGGIEKGQSNQENCVANRTVAMSTSMEFTRPIPSNIEVGFGGIENGQSNQENCVANRTVAMSTSMEFTRPVPSKIEVGFGGIENVQSNQENCVANRTVGMSTSMEFTRPVPSNIEVGFGGIENVQSNQENCVANRTVGMSTSMEFTRPVPSNIEVGFGGIENVQSNQENCVANRTVAMSTSMEFTRSVPSKIEVGFGGIDNIQSNEENVVVNPSRTVAMSTSLELTRPMSCHVPIGSASIQNENIFTDENGQENNSVNINEPSENGKCLQNIMEDSKPMDRSGIFVEQTSMEQTVDYSAKIEDTFAFVADPFQSKPCLASSPCAQSGIEALLSHSLVKKNTGQDLMEIDHFVAGKSLPIDSNNFVTICSEPQEKALLEQCNLSVKTPSEKTSSPRIPSSTGTSVGKPPLIQEGLPQSRTPDKIICTAASGLEIGSSHMDKSNPFLDISDPFKPKAKICNTPIKPSNELLSSSSKSVGVRKDDAQSMSLNVHRDNEKDLCMLLDEPPPFQDVPSFSMDISASVNDSGANLLHNTIKNAEITLQGILSPDFKKMQPEAAWEEGMDCDPIPHEGITKEQTCSTLMPSSEVDSHLCHQSTSYEGGADVISILKSREGAEKIENTKNAQRPQDDSLNHRTVDPERSDDTVSAKRLCPFTPEAVNAKHQKTLNPKLGSDLATEISHIFSPNSSVENSRTASTSADLSLHLDDVIFNLKSFMWKACKIDEDFWSFKYNYHCLELKIHLKLSSTTEGIVEGSNGKFVSHVTDSTKPVTRWGMDILMAKLKTREWDSFLHHSPNFLEAMGNLDKLVSQNKRFLVETITQEGFLNLKFKQDSFSGYITSEKLQLLFQVTLKLDLLEKYTPHHIQVLNVIGEVRETEVKNLITGVKKDLFFIRNYFRDVKDYVKTLESFL